MLGQDPSNFVGGRDEDYVADRESSDEDEHVVNELSDNYDEQYASQEHDVNHVICESAENVVKDIVERVEQDRNVSTDVSDTVIPVDTTIVPDETYENVIGVVPVAQHPAQLTYNIWLVKVSLICLNSWGSMSLIPSIQYIRNQQINP